MNDTTTDKKDADDSAPKGGERLRLARRENDISVADIAKELHLDLPKVRALERNEFDVLGAPVFAKGHLRKYAELVGVAVDDVMADYYQMTRSAGAPPVVGPKRINARDVSLGPWVGGGVVLVGIVAIAYWWFQREPVAPVVAVEPATLAPFSAPDTEPAAVVEETIPDDTATAEVDTVPMPVEQPVSDDIVPTVVQSTAVVENPGPQVQMELAFSGDCWTEVSDGTGRRLYYDLGQSGSVISLSGTAPLRVILGDSANVSIKVDGRDYPIPASARSGRLARLNVSSQ